MCGGGGVDTSMEMTEEQEGDWPGKSGGMSLTVREDAFHIWRHAPDRKAIKLDRAFGNRTFEGFSIVCCFHDASRWPFW